MSDHSGAPDDWDDLSSYEQARNAMSGTVHGPSVQAGRIYGGVHFTVQGPPPSGPGVKPDQVPPVMIKVFNHAAPFAQVNSHLTDDPDASARVGCGVLFGLPGIGKTTLACWWAHKTRHRFPDGQIFIDFAALRAKAGGDTAEAVAMGLRSLGMDDAHIPKSLEERAAHFRSLSADRRILIVLDNVNQPAQVLTMLPKGPGSALLATTGKKLGELAGHARLIGLDPLEKADGLDLLTHLCGDAVAADRGAAGALVEFCGGLPKALHVVAARLNTSSRLTVRCLVDELADEANRLAGLALGEEHSLSAVFGVTYRDLPPEAARAYRLLGWVPGETFDAGTAAAAVDRDTRTTQRLLDALEAARLLDVTADGRFRFHRLVLLHARECAEGEEPVGAQRELVERVATRYLALTAFADRAVREDRLRIADLTGFLRQASNPFAAHDADDANDPDNADNGLVPLDWMDAERDNILAVLRTATAHALHHHVWQLAEAFTPLFFHIRYLLPWKESLELGAAAAAADGVPAAEARLRSLLSRPLMDLGEYEQARAALESAVACAEVSGDTVLRASVQEFFGRYWDRVDASKAVRAYTRSLELNVQAEEWRGAAIARFFLGCAQDAEGDHAAALQTLQRAHQELTARADLRMAARADAAIGAAHERLGDTDAAIVVLSRAVDALRKTKASHYEAQTRVRLADLTERTGGPRAAVREHLARAFAIYEKGGSLEAQDLRKRIDGLDATDEAEPGDDDQE